MTGMADARTGGGRLPLPALLSQLLVAFTIEFDNEFEHQMPHRTTGHGSTSGLGRVPWLVSMAMWVHCMRLVPQDGIPAGELFRRGHLSAKSAQMVVKRMGKWWGYLVVEPDPAETRAKPPPSVWLVRPTSAGRQAQHVWGPLTGAIENRWWARFGGEAVKQLQATLGEIVSRLDVELPDFLPIGKPRLAPRPTPYRADAGFQLTLPALMSKVLLAVRTRLRARIGPVARDLHVRGSDPPRDQRQHPAGPR
jgi:hypothetical protein